MIQILHDTNFHFMKYRRYFYAFSAAVMLATLGWLIVHGGPRYSVDFTGGTLLQVKTAKVVPADHLRHAFDQAGYKGSEIQASGDGTEFLVRLRSQDPKRDPFIEMKKQLDQMEPGANVELKRVE